MLYKLTNGSTVHQTGTLAQCQAHSAYHRPGVYIAEVREMEAQPDETAAIRLNLRGAA